MVLGDGGVTLALAAEDLPAQQGGAKALLLTVLGEFVLPSGGEAWTSSLVGAAETLGIGEKNARQAIARIGDQGLIVACRHGRRVRWSLTPDGHELLETGTRRIYEFGAGRADWSGEWLVAHCQVSESKRALRTQLRTQLGFLGFGEISASLLISPHLDREPALRQVLRQLGLLRDSTVMRSTLASAEENAELVERAWDLGALVDRYRSFDRTHHRADDLPANEAGAAAFRALVELVHDWRRFPFIDPELPTALLPAPWAGTTAAARFRERHGELTGPAQTWFHDLDSRDATTI